MWLQAQNAVKGWTRFSLGKVSCCTPLLGISKTYARIVIWVLLMWTEDIVISSLMPLPLSISSCLSFPVLHTFVILRVWNQLPDADPDKSQGSRILCSSVASLLASLWTMNSKRVVKTLNPKPKHKEASVSHWWSDPHITVWWHCWNWQQLCNPRIKPKRVLLA